MKVARCGLSVAECTSHRLKRMLTWFQVEAGGSSRFLIDAWRRTAGGGGVTGIMSQGKVFEKAGVNISVVHGELPPQAVLQMKSRGKDFPEEGPVPFFAAGISCVIHPLNPHVPTIHFNYRYFAIPSSDEKSLRMAWFGGGTDLTPYYLDEGDVKHFHSVLRTACDGSDPEYYPKFKDWCDRYFHVTHRGECRGVGGIFFDDLEATQKNFEFVTSCCSTVGASYLPLVRRQMSKPYDEEMRRWQLLRRGRYVEFNLVYDRGTKFGLHTPEARIESILMSLPLLARWEYCHEPQEDSPEGQLMKVLKKPRDWL
ncbi:unnamed protein product [Cyprideis torosa]|uniref:coproporphyrinogen oxidase n=1 Tax=Cyprideis torosa TaxID=163714 RepID=A0A7R8ZHF4_9CRUS|nr:unnamed protein product [Cyprideis torosa]CAG0883543.1 unnamed protein product [Cyprideis torosa]